MIDLPILFSAPMTRARHKRKDRRPVRDDGLKSAYRLIKIDFNSTKTYRAAPKDRGH
jgi:hypothetical protein